MLIGQVCDIYTMGTPIIFNKTSLKIQKKMNVYEKKCFVTPTIMKRKKVISKTITILENIVLLSF